MDSAVVVNRKLWMRSSQVWLERLTAYAEVATFLVSIPASSYTVLNKVMKKYISGTAVYSRHIPSSVEDNVNRNQW